MSAATDGIRRATLAASRLHRDLGLRSNSNLKNGRIDVFDVLATLDVPLIFKPLESLLGVYLNEPVPGVLVTTKRSLNVQRFTAAHELGHFRLNHTPSLDDESILRRSPFMPQKGIDIREIEADAFAAAFLLPRWLAEWHCEQQAWDESSLLEPRVVYQLSLRTGTSYTATCWTLLRYGMLSQFAAKQLVSIAPKTIKKETLGNIELENYYADVWSLSDRDLGLRIEGGPSDLFVFSLKEHSGSGYLWQLQDLDDRGFAVLSDTREAESRSEAVGGHVNRRVITQSKQAQFGEVQLCESRPWQSERPISSYIVKFDLFGSEGDGWSRAERRNRLEAA